MKRLFVLILCVISCSNQNIPKTVKLKKTQKIQVKESWKSIHSLSYLWSIDEGPKNHNSDWSTDGDIMLFTPGKIGAYTITVSIETSMGKTLGEEKFYYNVIKNNQIQNTQLQKEILSIDDNKTISENKLKLVENKKTNDKLKKHSLSSGYTVQISSWDNSEDAKKDQNYLVNNGFDAYIKKFNNWHRVRVGKNLTHENCKKLILELKKITRNDIWIDKY